VTVAITVRELAEAALAARLVERERLAAIPGWERFGCDRFVEVLTTAERIPPSAIYRAVAEKRGLPFEDCETAEPALERARRLPDVLLRRGLVLPLRSGSIATADPDDRETVALVRRLLGPDGRIAVGEPQAVRMAALRVLAALGRVVEQDSEAAENSVSLFDAILKEAYLRRASDVHFEPDGAGMGVRVRIDGVLRPLVRRLRGEEGLGLVSRLKVLAGLDIAEQRAPQDGGFTYSLPVAGTDPIDIRAATISTHAGERATLRLLGTASRDLTLERLGMVAEDLERFRAGIRRPHGLLVLCGPTGCGKSTTLSAALREITRPEVNVMTVEDPIEYRIPGASQVQVGAAGKVTFARAIRSLLRHDPDILMIGEIRDAETADIALKAAMTGHLVLSTLHTNSAAGALTRLLDLGCEPYRVAGTLIGAVAQRLVRRLCPRCRTTRPPTEEEAGFFGSDEELPAPTGCARCLGTGFSGRVGLFEVLPVGPEQARAIAAGLPGTDAPRRTLREDGVAKVRARITTAEEVMRATMVEE
jgi:type IV pilus assembly protein PilB